MNIDLTSLVTGLKEEIEIDVNVDFSLDELKDTDIKSLHDTSFKGTITRLTDSGYTIEGNLKGTMVLADAITLEDVDYEFSSYISQEFDEFEENNENNLKIVKNILDIKEFLWQNILVEVPLKVVSEKNKDLRLEGNGWRFIKEEDIDIHNNSPFKELEEKFNSRKE